MMRAGSIILLIHAAILATVGSMVLLDTYDASSYALMALGSEEWERWSRHWNYGGYLMVIGAVVSSVAAFGLWKKKAWAILVAAIVFAFFALHDLVRFYAGSSIYGFEQPSIVESLVYGGMAILTLALYFRSRGQSQFT